MKAFAVAVLLISASAAVTFAQTPAAKGPSASATVKQLEKDWTEASKANDMDKLGAILADDWYGIGPDGARITKKDYLDMYKSGKTKTETIEIGSMEVKVLGNVAVVQGTDTEKSTFDGKDSSGKYAWMDVFAKRDGKWVAVRSQTAHVGK
ncbi:MAG TPA: nuclear transport factor 2 family protein [Candidatus Acidoferrum sp.]